MAALPQQPAILSFDDARHLVERHAAEVRTGEVETEQLLASIGRVLAKPVVADRDFPPFPCAPVISRNFPQLWK
jgi:molybdopterin biosynthesis enzyme